MQGAQHFLGGKITVGDKPDKERGYDRGDRIDGKRPLSELGHSMVGHIDPDHGIPCPPNKELQEHERRKLKSGRCFHYYSVEWQFRKKRYNRKTYPVKISQSDT